MVFTTWPFAFFMAFIFVTYWWVVPHKFRAGYLLIASIAYFTYNYPPHAILLGALTLLVYGLGRLMISLRDRMTKAETESLTPTEQADSAASSSEPATGDAKLTSLKHSYKMTLVVGLVICALFLCYYKYSPMLVASWNSIAKSVDPDATFPVPKLLVPIGISFFTFEFIHYLTDLYFGRVKRGSFFDFSLFAFFFPSLVSGPIKRYQIFQEQTESLKGFQTHYLSEGLHRIVIGLAKKIVIADTAHLFTVALNDPSHSSRLSLWIAMYAYAVKIYYDFSVYTDIAIGCAQLLGYRLPENFNRPYRQRNLSVFWNNWHMSLSSWIRDYLFFPLGGSRVGKVRTLFNLTIVMSICGLWHGANWNFLVWGLWHGLGLALLRVYGETIGKRVPDSRWVRWAGTALTIQFVCIGWVLFASPDVSTALTSFRRML
jgi:alginate O-acetyltransferase complex protein AlgI